jgi:hypothetical protein
MTNIIETLKSDAEYYGGVGKNYLSNSDIGALLSNPNEFGVQREDNKTFAEGRYFHQLLLEPEKAKAVQFVDASSRNTNIYKEFIEKSGMPFCMLSKEGEEIRALASTMKGNINFYEEIYRDGNVFEQPAVGSIQGMMWKGKADIVTNDSIIDLKTTGDIHKFKWSAKAYNYDSQCYIYEQLFGKPLVFYVIDKSTHQLGIFTPSENFIKGGELKVAKAIEVYKAYFGDNPTDDIINYYIDETLD